MSIASRIESIEEHIGNAYDSIEALGVDITDIDKNIENISSSIDGIYDTLPKVTDEGESITLDGTIKGRLKTTLKGNTSQNGTPTPSSPIPVNVVSGDNTINVVGKNLYNDRFSDYTRPADYRIFPIDLKKGQQYVLKATLKGTTMSGIVVAVVPYGNKYSDFSTKLNMAINNTGTTYSILITPDDTWTSPKLVIYASDETTFNSIFENYNIQLEKGSTATTYEPYKRTDYDVNLGVVNLFDKDNANIINTYLINDGDGTLPSDGGERNNCAYIPCKSNTTYTIQKMEGKRFKVGYTYSTPTIGGNVYGKTGANNDTQITITTNSQAQYLIVYLRNGNVSGEITLQQALDSLQIEEGNKASSYSPYGQTPIELCKIGDYQDYFYKDSGKWYLHKEVGKNTITSISSVGTASTGINYALVGSISTANVDSFVYCEIYSNSTDASKNKFICL